MRHQHSAPLDYVIFRPHKAETQQNPGAIGEPLPHAFQNSHICRAESDAEDEVRKGLERRLQHFSDQENFTLDPTGCSRVFKFQTVNSETVTYLS